jgi:hypothetical protein
MLLRSVQDFKAAKNEIAEALRAVLLQPGKFTGESGVKFPG